jgi:hypothetical protein
LESKLNGDGVGPDVAQVKANNLISEYVNSSFMSANERFNSAMVFESMLDEQGIR